MTLTKADIIETVYSELDLSKNRSTELVEQLLEIIKHTLASGDDVMISGFGKFQVQNKRQRRGRNPATGESMMLSPRKVVTFKCSRKLRDKINSL
ncbi:MAG TPA: integration host factor subunit alpha [Desulfobacterales bacterium]|jgi:integration host factor subunit alpha